jgi:hypothetical protein
MKELDRMVSILKGLVHEEYLLSEEFVALHSNNPEDSVLDLKPTDETLREN